MTIVLMYHDVVSVEDRDTCGFPGPVAGRYKLDPEQFEHHLDAIGRTGGEVGLLAEQREAAITFDDGGASALRAAEALERRGWRGHFFITTGRIGTPGFLDADGVRQLAARGHDVGAHSVTHPTYMGSLPRAEIAREWRDSREQLAEVLGRPPSTAAVPGGFLSRAVIEEAAAAGFTVLFTSQPTVRPRRRGPLRVQGRFTIWSATPASRVAAYVTGSSGARAGTWLAWQLKTVPKMISPPAYQRVRQAWARVRPGAPAAQ
jgi:peptidoglycan/xylan/chitin deacetylase (PgdA/CDA1 family)